MRTPKYLKSEGGLKCNCYVHYFNLQFPSCFLVRLEVGVKFKGIIRKNQCLSLSKWQYCDFNKGVLYSNVEV